MKEEATIPKILLALLLFGGAGFFAITIFLCSLYDLIRNLIYQPEIIEYERGAMYGLGTGISFSSFFIAFITLLFYRKISPEAENRIAKGIVVGLGLTFAIPIMAGLTVPNLIESENYQRCEKAEYRPSWPQYRTHIYTDTEQACEQLVKKEEKPKIHKSRRNISYGPRRVHDNFW